MTKPSKKINNMKKILKWKFIEKGFRSRHHKWKIGKWYSVTGNIEACVSGFHCSDGVYQAFLYVQGPILARVEVRGDSDIEEDKSAWREMKVSKAYKWTKKDSVALSIYAAELCINNYEKEYPNDLRPREAIEAAKRWLKTGSKKGLVAAWSAAGSACSALIEKIAIWMSKRQKTLEVYK